MSSQTPIARGVRRHRLQRPRSRNGCLTCKRRKVRCTEQKPRCYDCQRLELECVWGDARPPRPSLPRSPPKDTTIAEDPPESDIAALELSWPSPTTDPFDFPPPAGDPSGVFSLFQDIHLPDFDDSSAARHPLHERMQSTDNTQTPNSPPAPSLSPVPSPLPNNDTDESMLLHALPILDPVENGPICASLRALLDRMVASSPMVRYSISAFAALQFYNNSSGTADYQRYHDKAAHELSKRFHKSGNGVVADSNELIYILTTIFFLTYINFLTGRLDLAYSNLAKAHKALQTYSRGALNSLEWRIISWVRWSDARAALTGGEGLLVNDTSGIYPSSPDSAPPSPEPQSTSSARSDGPHEVIYDMLCQPGIAFFQEVQTVTGRITRIAHDHRSRGTVEDETEVMAIAADISKDLSSLYDRRPALMDHAVAGNIGGDTLAEPLASTIALSFQAYLVNFYACYIHLHRVAHRHLPHSKAVTRALGKTKEIVHLMVQNDKSIPVNILWPLFLWGTEEEDREECEWILKTIRSLRHVATNANMAADALQEIQRRQRGLGARVHISSVCLELFNAPIAII